MDKKEEQAKTNQSNTLVDTLWASFGPLASCLVHLSQCSNLHDTNASMPGPVAEPSSRDRE